MKNRIFDVIMPMLPKNDLSHFVGRLVHHPLPGNIGRKSVEWFAKYYSINLDEAEHPITHYKTIGELFTRKLKSDARPVGRDVVHCADAVVSEAGPIEHETLIQAKGKNYTVTELLKTNEFTESFDHGHFMTYYLCPTDYHRVHSAVDGEIIWSKHIPGTMWPVNEWSVNAIPGLFAINERVAIVIQTPRGKIGLVMVAATNVGNMSMTFDPDIMTKVRKGNRQPKERHYSPALPIERGEEVGIFHMGSTVVMLFERGVLPEAPVKYKGKPTKMGASLF
ncbi:MAG: archaetidylserine decarboxylase [Bdellovibrionota bacterium]